MTGETTHNLRGDYSGMRPDYTVEQAWSAYTPEEHALWRRLYARQAALVPAYACEEFIASLAAHDPERAAAAMKRHVDEAGRTLLAAMRAQA